MAPPRSSPPRSDAGVRHSPLEDRHEALGARLVHFGGWSMPLSYPGGTVAEHLACRRSAAVFDVSHLGTVRVEGAGAFEVLQEAFTNDLRKVGPGRAQYSHLLDTSDASVVDDLIVWWVEREVFDVMPNASNTTRVREAIGGLETTSTRAVLAVQGPEARRMLSNVSADAAGVPRFAVRGFVWRGSPCLAAGTGYTGEDGVECAVPADIAGAFFEEVIDAGVTPAGLGARDTLRLEAGLPLHGHELGPGITPLQAGLGWVVGWDKGAFRGRTALERERATGPARILRGVVADGRQPLRDGATITRDGEVVGEVTSGNFSPVLSRGIGLALVSSAAALTEGDAVELEVRSRTLDGHVASTPFVRPASSQRREHLGTGAA